MARTTYMAQMIERLNLGFKAFQTNVSRTLGAFSRVLVSAGFRVHKTSGLILKIKMHLNCEP